MKKYEITVEVTAFSFEELSTNDQDLVTAAINATKNSYSPYSEFKVGAALRLEDGKIITGSNQENASYPLSLCAERTAIFHAQHSYPEQHITTIAIAAQNKNGFLKDPIPPCGACRQVMLEVEDRYNKPMRVLLYSTQGIHVVQTAKDLMPFQFLGNSMK